MNPVEVISEKNRNCKVIAISTVLRDTITAQDNNSKLKLSNSQLMDFLPLFSSPPLSAAVDDSVFVIKKQGNGEEEENGRTFSAQSIQSRGRSGYSFLEKE